MKLFRRKKNPETILHELRDAARDIAGYINTR